MLDIFRNKTHLAIVLHDSVQTVIAWEMAIFLAYALNHALVPMTLYGDLWNLRGGVILSALCVYLWSGLYRGLWRYVSIEDILTIFRCVMGILAGTTFLLFILTRLESIPRSSLVYFPIILVILLIGPRLVYRGVKDGSFALPARHPVSVQIPVLLIGSQELTEVFIREMGRHKHSPYRVVGILATAQGLVGRNIRGIHVMGRVSDMPQCLKTLEKRGSVVKPHRIIVTDTDIGPETLKHILKSASDAGIPLSRLPRLTDFKSGDTKGVIQPIDVEDLLGRPQCTLDRDMMTTLIKGRRILITGAGGTIGSELARQIAVLNPSHMTLMDNGEYVSYRIDQELTDLEPHLSRSVILGDIRDPDRVRHVFAQARPHIVFHAAAFKHVPLVEANPNEGVLTNVIGTRIIADTCCTYGVETMVLVSSDKAVNPTNIMGASKRIAEMYCQALASEPATRTRFVTVRFGNVLGSTGSVVPLFQKQIASGGPVTVTHPDVTRFFMTTREAVGLILQASALATSPVDIPETLDKTESVDRSQIFVLDMGDSIKIQSLARTMIRLAGLVPDKDVPVIFTGLRPGEKLYEEPLHESESLLPTGLSGILRARPRFIDFSTLIPLLTHLGQAAQDRKTDQTLAYLRILVPEYESPDPETLV